jgi:hypothetical protein
MRRVSAPIAGPTITPIRPGTEADVQGVGQPRRWHAAGSDRVLVPFAGLRFGVESFAPYREELGGEVPRVSRLR